MGVPVGVLVKVGVLVGEGVGGIQAPVSTTVLSPGPKRTVPEQAQISTKVKNGNDVLPLVPSQLV